MADDRRRRFLQIERPRGPGPAEPPGPAAPEGAVGGRFGAVEGGAPDLPAGAAPAPVAPGHVDRFRPPPDRPLEVADRAEGQQPFVRCERCETDNALFAVRCSTCGAELHTDAQRAFNERLWAGRRADAAAEAAQAAERRLQQEAAAVEAAQARRAAAEALAWEVGQRERQRLSGEGFGGPAWGPGTGDPAAGGGTGWSRTGPGPDAGTPPLALRLLLGIPDPRWRVAAGVAAVAVPALLFVAAPRLGLVAGILLISAFLPGGWTRRRRRW